MNEFNYCICYTDHRNDAHKIGFTAYEDGERVAQFIADLYGSCVLGDGFYIRSFMREE